MPDTVVGPAGSPDRAAQLDREADTMIQMLTPEGERPDPAGAALEYAPYVADVTDDDLRGMYRDMVVVRRFDAEATALQRQGELGLWASLLGQEAAQVGSGRALRPQDFAYPTYREHGVAWCRGVPPTALLGLYRGASLGGWDPAEHGFALYTIVIGSQTLHATGYAMGLQRDHAVGTGEPDRDAAVIAYLGDGATSQGDVSEALVFSAVYNAPVVFFCQNNQWAISEPNTRQTRVPLYKRSSGFGIPGRAGRRQRRAGHPRGHPRRHRARPLRRRAHLRRGVHVPDGRPHHLRRPQPLPHRRGARGVEAQGPDRPGQGLPGPLRRGRRGVVRRGRGRGQGRSPPSSGPRAGRCPTRVRSRCSTTSTPSRTPSWTPSGRSTWPTGPASRDQGATA